SGPGAAVLSTLSLHDALPISGHRGEGFGVVDGGGLAVQAEAGRERRLEARLALLAFERFEQRRFFAADVRAIAMERMQLEAEFRSEEHTSELQSRENLVCRLL